MKRLSSLYLSFIVILFPLKAIWGQALVTENFNQAVGTSINGNGWTAHSGVGTNPITVTSPGLSYTGYIGSGIGNAVTLTTSGEDDNKSLSSSVTSGSIYAAVLVNCSAAKAAGDYFFHLGTGSSYFYTRLYIKSSGAGFVFGITHSSGTPIYTSTVYNFNTTYLVVVKYTYVAGGTTNDVANLFILPYPASPPLAATEPAADLTSTDTGTDATSISGVYLRQGSSSNAPNEQVDGIRVATSWNDLLFVPQATSATTVLATSFTANWNAVGGATGYYLDVATDAAFTSLVAGYNNIDVGNVTTYSVIGLTAGVTYYYRIRAYDASANVGPSSNTINVTTIQLVLGSSEAAALNYTEGDPATAITATTAITSSVANLDGGVIQITGNYKNGEDVLAFTNTVSITGVWDATTGKITLSGTDTYSNYQAAIRAVTYQNTSQNPSTAQRTVSFTVSIGSFNSNTVTRTISVTPVNNPPVLSAIELAVLSYSTGAAKQITSTLTAVDVDNTTMASATVQITGNYDNGKDALLFTDQNGITGTWNSATGTLTLTGTMGLTYYVTALRSVQFQNSSLSASTLQRTVSFILNDGAANSNIVTRNINVNNTPVLAGIEGTELSYSPGSPATTITSTITVNDPDPANLASAIIYFSGFYEYGKDLLAYNPPAPAVVSSYKNSGISKSQLWVGITSSWDATTGTLTLNGPATIAQFQSALRYVTYQNTSATPVKLIRTISFMVNDGMANSNSITRDINLGFVAPTLTGIEGTALSYKQGDGEKNVTSTITINSPSSPLISSAIVQITDNYRKGEDVLTCLNQNQIIAVWDPVGGKIDLSWSSSVVNYQTALRSVTYKNVSATPNTLPRTVSFVINDGYNSSNTVTRIIDVSKVTNVIVSASPSEGGTVSGGGSYFSGNNVTVSAAPNTGYNFVNWTEGGTEVSTNASYTFTINSSRTLTANFTLIQCTIATSSSPNTGGTTTGDGTYNYGTSVTVTATSSQGYKFVNWTSNGAAVSTSASYTFTINGNLNLVANFMMLPVLTVTPDFVSVSPVAGTATFNVTNTGGGTMDWTAASDIFWIQIKNGASGTNNGTITVNYNHNNSAARIGTITITSSGVKGSPKTVEVRQEEPVTFVESLNLGIPDNFKLEQNYPNPFNPSTKIRYGLPKESNVVLTVYNILGGEVARLVDGVQSAGYYEANFAATNLSSGIYVYKISAGSFTQIKKMLLMK